MRACESSKAQLSQINTTSTTDAAHAIESRPVNRRFAKKPELSQLIPRAQPDQQPATNQHSTPPTNTVDGQQHFRCNKCGRHHRKNRCRVSNVRCFTCGVIGHVSSCCPSSSNTRQVSSRQAPNPTAKVHTVEGEMQWVGDVESGGTVMTPAVS